MPRRFGDRLLLVVTLGLLLGIGMRLGLLRPNRAHIASQVLFSILILVGLHARRGSERAAARNLMLVAPAAALTIHLFVVGLIPTMDLSLYHQREAWKIGSTIVRLLKGQLVPPFTRLPELHREAVEEVRRLEPMPRPEGEVDVFGQSQGAALAHGLDLRLRPVFQSQKAYSPDLAALNESFYRGGRAPEFALMNLQSYRNFYPMAFDGPAILELLRCYARPQREGEFLLLARKQCSEPSRQLVLDRSVALGTRLDLSEHEGDRLLWLEVEVDRSLIGKVLAFFWVPGHLRLDVTPATGGPVAFRLAPRIGRTGFLLSPMVLDSADLERLFDLGGAGPALPAVESITLYGLGRTTAEFKAFARVRVYSIEGLGPAAATGGELASIRRLSSTSSGAPRGVPPSP